MQTSAGAALGGSLGSSVHHRAIDQFHEGHGRVVADPETHLQDAGVAPGTRLVSRAQLVEELGDDVAVTRAVEGEASVGQVGSLASVMRGSTTRRSSLAFGTVVLIASCVMSELHMFRSIARRWELVRLSLRSP
jgi:hypothetical protein